MVNNMLYIYKNEHANIINYHMYSYPHINCIVHFYILYTCLYVNIYIKTYMYALKTANSKSQLMV